jgi:hypothetical protein
MVPIQADELRCRIEKQFEGIEYRGDVVLSVVNNFVFDLKGDSQPYFHLRVFLTGDAFKDSEDIERRLEILNMDIEMLDLRKIVHAKK